MKLHLPKLLRNAVLACITAVAGVSATVGSAAITGGVAVFALAGNQAEAGVPAAAFSDEGTTRTYTGTGTIDMPAADSGITKIVFGMSEPGLGDNRSYFASADGFTCGTAVQIGTSAENGLDLNDGYSSATYTFTGAISGEGIWRVMGNPTSKTKITGSMEEFTGQLIGGPNPTFQLATTCKASAVNIGNLQLVGSVTFSGGSADEHATITLGTVTSDAGTQLTLGEYTDTTLNGTIALRNSIDNHGGITLGSNVVFDLSNLTAVDGKYTLFTNAVDLSGLNASNVSGLVLNDGEAITLNTDGTISVVQGTVGTIKWKNNGTTNSWAAVPDKNWTAVDGTDAFFCSGCTVQFGESATDTGETIDMLGNLKIGGMTVNGTGWEFAGSGNIGAWGTEDAIVGSGELALGEGASVSFSGGGDLLFTGITAGSESTLKITGGTELYTRTASAISVPELELNNGTLSIVPQDNTSARLQVGVQALVTAGESILETRRSGASYAANVTVSSLSGSGTIKFRSGSQEGMATVFTIGGAANFSGEIHLVGNAKENSDRRVTLNLDSATVAQNAVVKFSSSNDRQNLQFGVGADGATVAGLDGSVTGNNSTLTIFSGKGIISSSAAAGDGVGRTLNIATTASTANWSTSATVLANLNLAKSGAGTQSFTGDLSAFNGTISVSGGVLNMSSIGSASSISLTSSGATLGVTGTTTTGEGDAAVTTPNSVNLTSGKSLSVVNGAVLNSALTLGGGTLALGTDSSAWATDNGLSLNNHALVFGADRTELSLNLGSVALAAGDTIDLFKDVASVELATGATLDTYFSGLDEALKTATLSLAEGRLVATLAAAYESSAPSSTPSSATIRLAMPPSGVDKGGHGYITATQALTEFADEADGGYMFNNGGGAGTNATTGEGILTTTDGVTSITLAPRAGAGGTGEVIVLSASELNGYEVDSFTFSIASSSSADVTGNIALTLAVVKGVVGEDDSTTWSVSGDTATGSLTIGSGASVTLDLAESITWSELYKVVAMMDNTGKLLQGGNGALYTLSGISISASLSGSTLPLQMPNSVAEATQTTGWGTTVESAINTAKSKAYGYYVGPATSNIAADSWTTPTMTINDRVYKEGSWDNETGIVVLAGRSGVSGLVASFVLGEELEAGSTVSAITFNAAGYEHNTLSGDVQIGLGIRDAAGNVIDGIADVTGSFLSTSTDITSITLGGSVEWAEGYKIIAVIKGLSGTATTAYAITNVSLSYQLGNATPPPAVPTDYYWESTSTTGSWSEANWSTEDNVTSGLTSLPASGAVNVVFNNQETAEISIGAGVSVNAMSVTDGTYTFTGDSAATLEVAGTLMVGSGATANMGTAVEAGSVVVEGTLGISQTITVAENGTVTLDSAGTINLQDFEPTTSTTEFTEGVNGFGSTTNTYKVFDGGSITGTIGTWQIDGTAASGTFDGSTGEYTITTDGEIYGVGSGTVNSSDVTGATGIALNGGKLVLDAAPTEDGYITATEKGGTLDLNGLYVEQSVLGTLDSTTELEGNVNSVYDLGDGTSLAGNLELSETDWKGTVKMGAIAAPDADLDITSLGCDGSSIEMGVVSVKSLTSTSAASVRADALTLGAASGIDGALTLTGNTLTLGSADASLTAGSLNTTSGILTIAAASQDVLDALNIKASQGEVTILTLTDGFTGELAQADIVVPARAAAPVEKYYATLQWNQGKTQLSYIAQVNPDYVESLVEASTKNGRAGVALLQQALEQKNPQVTAPDSALAAVLDAVDAGELSEEGAAAVAGASTAVLGMAAHGDLDRQLQAIRNRTTTMGVDQNVVHHDMPYFNAWINAEGAYSELSDDGTEGGYKLNSWGGTVGFDVDITPTFTAGLALTAMYGDLDVTGADTASGELNTYYVSAFARYCASAWTHTFVATAGLSDISLDRTVMGEKLEGETDGVSFGFMYEVGRVFALDEDGTACLQPIFNVTWRHTSVSGYTEDGSDLALDVDDQTLDTVTFGVGARMQAIVGESMYNRTSIFECRVLAKFDAGDRRGTSDVALAALGGNTQEVESAERGPIGLEAGAGLTIPLGDEGGSLFMDASVELRADYTNVNGTVGYRVNF